MDSREVQNTLRPVAKKLISKLAHSFFASRQAVVIDGTGRDYEKIESLRMNLKICARTRSFFPVCPFLYISANLSWQELSHKFAPKVNHRNASA